MISLLFECKASVRDVFVFVIPSLCAMHGERKSKSIIATLLPLSARSQAKLRLIDDLPSPDNVLVTSTVL